MIIVKEALPTNGRSYYLSGNFFKLLSTDQPIDVFLSSRGFPDIEARAITGGYFARGPIEAVRIIPPVGIATTVKFVVSDDEVGDSVIFGNFAPGDALGFSPFQQGLPVAELGLTPATFFASTALIAAGATLQVQGGAGPQKNILIHDSEIVTGSLAVQTLALIANSAGVPPGTITTGSPIHSAAALAGALSSSGRLSTRLRVGPGLGLWYFSAALEQAPVYKKVAYTNQF